MKVLLKKKPWTVEGFQMSCFDLSQTCEIAFTENCCIWKFSGTFSVYTFITKYREALDLLKNLSIEYWRRLRRIIRKKLLTQRISEKK